jgi:hypothetical protein
MNGHGQGVGFVVDNVTHGEVAKDPDQKLSVPLRTLLSGELNAAYRETTGVGH